MKNFCPNCGSQLAEGSAFCGNCGATINMNGMGGNNTGMPNMQGFGPAPTIKKREIILAIIFSIISCGIYSIYWFVVMTDEANKVNHENGTSGALAFLFTLLTCGIYGIYWYYKMGKRLYEAGQKAGKDISDNSVIYLLLGLFGLGIVNYCLIQNDLNKFAN